jgi:hypothetical protein
VQFRTTIHQISRCTSNPRQSTNGQHQGRESTQLEDSDECHGSLKIPGFHGLLPLLHQRLLEDRPTTTATDTPNDTLVMANRRTNSIRDTLQSNDRQTSAASTRLYKAILPTDRHIGIWCGSHTLTRGWILELKHHLKTQTPPRHVLLCHIHRNRMQL